MKHGELFRVIHGIHQLIDDCFVLEQQRVSQQLNLSVKHGGLVERRCRSDQVKLLFRCGHSYWARSDKKIVFKAMALSSLDSASGSQGGDRYEQKEHRQSGGHGVGVLALRTL